MALSEFEIKKCEKELEAFLTEHRPPIEVRSQVDFGYRIEDQSVEIFEIRPRRDNPSEIIEIPIAKATYVNSRKLWKIYWQKSDLQWHLYEPLPEVKILESFLNAVIEDQYAYFFG